MTVHSEVKVLPFTQKQLYNLVLDVKSYPEFVPWVLQSRIFNLSDKSFYAELQIGYKFIRQNYTSHITFQESEQIFVEGVKGPFHHLNNKWYFQKLDESSTTVHFEIDFEFDNSVFGKILQPIFQKASFMMIEAFANRANEIYKN